MNSQQTMKLTAQQQQSFVACLKAGVLRELGKRGALTESQIRKLAVKH